MALNKELYIDDVRMVGNWNRLYYNGLPEVMTKWENNKQNLYKILGNKVIIERIHAYEFIKKIIIHIPEKNFKMIRYFGIYFLLVDI